MENYFILLGIREFPVKSRECCDDFVAFVLKYLNFTLIFWEHDHV
jgi:hypothetical protein